MSQPFDGSASVGSTAFSAAADDEFSSDVDLTGVAELDALDLDIELPPELANVAIDNIRDRIAREAALGVSKEEIEAMPLFQRFCYECSTHWAFNTVVLFAIVVNIGIICFSTFTIFSHYQWHCTLLENVLLGIYTTEFAVKVAAQPFKFWKSKFNVFDFVVLLISLVQLPIQYSSSNVSPVVQNVLKLCRVFRSLRAFRLVTFVHGLRTIVIALGRTLKGVVPLLFLIILFNYVFSIVAFHLFNDSGSPFWEDLASAFLTLFTYVTADNWTDVVYDTENAMPSLSVVARWFSLIYVFVGSFLLSNMFIGVVLQSLTDATQEEHALEFVMRASHVRLRRTALLQQQRRERQNILAALNKRSLRSAEDIVADLYGKVGSETAAVASPLTRLQWVAAYLTALAHEEGTLYKIQMLHYELAGVLCELMELKEQKTVAIY